MLFVRAFLVIYFIVLNFQSKTYADETVEILKKHVIGLEDSLSMDIRLLRQDISKNSEEFHRLAKLLDETLAAFKNGRINHFADPDSETKQLQMMQGLERMMERVKRAFAEEKVGLIKFTSTIKTEIDQLTNAINKGLSNFRLSHVETEKAMIENIDSFGKDLIEDLNKAMANLTTDLTSSIKILSSDVARETSIVITNMEKTSRKNGMVSDIRNSVEILSHNMSETSSQINDIKEQLKSFEDKFDKIFGLRLKKVKEYSVGNVGLKNITQTINTIAGRLEVKHEGEWGTVCDDAFGITDASVACTMLGFLSTNSFKLEAYYGQGTGPIWLDELGCSGTESSLFDCSHNGIGKHNCAHGEDVGIICDY